ncbi:hypothetical protein Poli38472_010142 [Pythium oligandrum]|uniref:M96 mating-specific protein family n=1 Tax=Pythium oligandrum TaxID=41045 RepID=A0A8K1C9D5_PYTOL|nr:hypothetical protein Poli38472_010142 [Pythium oligandrum]|eukprot:TMW58583.1 hypothetical protein Poli38472_010142 [Pythium oligandrum]
MDAEEMAEIAATTQFLEEADGVSLEEDDVSCLLTCLSPLRVESNEEMTSVPSKHDEFFSPEDEQILANEPVWRHGNELTVASPYDAITVQVSTARTFSKRRTDSNKARSERRQELLHLRETVAQLEKDLAALRLQQTPESTQSIAPRQKRERNGTKRHRVQGPWQTIAEHQRKDRQRVEAENVRLRVELDMQIQCARRLERVIRQSLRERSMEACGLHSDDGQSLSNGIAFDDPAVYAALMQYMEMRYMGVDALFERLGILDMEHSHHDTRVCRGEFGMEVEIFHNEVLPVPIDVASSLVWREFAEKMAHIPSRRYYERMREVVFTSEDTLLENIGFKIHFNNRIAHFRILQVLRRYVEADRIVIMWCSNYYAVEYLDQPMSGTVFRRNGCMLFKRPSTLDSNELSIFKMSNFIKPLTDTSFLNPAGEMSRDLIEFLLVEGTSAAAFLYQLIENSLLHEAMRNRRQQLGPL